MMNIQAAVKRRWEEVGKGDGDGGELLVEGFSRGFHLF